MHVNQFRKWLLIITLSFLLPVVWIVKIVRGTVPYVDVWTRGYVDVVADSFIYSIARWLTNFGSAFFLIPFTIIIGILLWIVFRDWLPVLFFAGGTLISHLLNMLIKKVVARERPMILLEVNAEGYSFPSGHSMITVVCYGALLYLIVKKYQGVKWLPVLQVFFPVFIFSIGISRYILNVHYLTDVFSGFVIGFFFLLGLISVYEFVEKLRNRKKSSF